MLLQGEFLRQYQRMYADEIEEEEDSLCAVCWGFGSKIVITECGHPACLSCLREKPFCCPACWEFSKLRTSLSDIVMYSEGDGMCELHREDQKLFCEIEQQLLCVTCSKSEDHQDHIHWPIAVAALSFRKRIQTDRDILGCHVKKIQELQLHEERRPLAWAVVWTAHEDISRKQFERKILEIWQYLKNKTETAKVEDLIMATGNEKFIKLYQRLKQMEALQKYDIMEQKKEWKTMMFTKSRFLMDKISELEEKSQKSNMELLQDVRDTFERTYIETNLEPFIPHMDTSYLKLAAGFLKFFHTSGLLQTCNSYTFSEEIKSAITFVPDSSGMIYSVFITGDLPADSVRMRAFLLRTLSQDRILLEKESSRTYTTIWTVFLKE